MPSDHDPAMSLAHIVANAERIDLYIAGMDQHDFERNHLVGDAVERCLERVCEAAYRLGPRAETMMPGQPWSQIRGMGNKLRHAFDQISRDVIWGTARYELPGLEAATRQAQANLEFGTPTA
jgi:uncharacterized protein with HEPN domain